MLSIKKSANEKEHWNNMFSQGVDFPDVFLKKKTDDYHPTVSSIAIPSQIVTEMNRITQKNNYLQFILYCTISQVLIYKLSDADTVTTLVSYDHNRINMEDANNSMYLNTKINHLDTIKQVLAAIRNDVIELSNYDPELQRNIMEGFCLEADIPVFLLTNNLVDESQKTKDMIVIQFDTVNNLAIKMHYNAAAIEKNKVCSFLKMYIHILEQSIGNASQKISLLSLLPKADCQMVVQTGRGKERQLACSVFEEIKKNIMTFPDKTAVVCGTKSLSYREVEKRSGQIAKCLNERGVKKGDIVGLYLYQSTDIVCVIVAMLQLGCIYMPIDKQLPVGRIQQMIDDSKIRIILIDEPDSSSGCLERVSMIPLCRIVDDSPIYLDTIVTKHQDGVYLIYTSGTTGRPKGIVVNNENLLNYIQWRSAVSLYTHNDITLQLISFAFDGYVSNLFSSLLNGGKLVLVEPKKRIDYAHICKIIENQGVTRMSLVPSMYRYILENSSRNSLRSIRSVVLAAERATDQILTMSSQLAPNADVINEYGPTECTVGIMANMMLSQDNLSDIGRVCDNNTVVILNKENQILPQGFLGELGFFGSSVSGGYLNLPDTTEQKFIQHPMAGEHKIYLTGDLGILEFSDRVSLYGRKDNQVKVNGVRFETAEIEQHLLKMEAISEAIVIVQKNEEGIATILAYYVSPKPIFQFDFTMVLSRYIPQSVMPNYFIHVNHSLPRTINGKIDIKALPLPVKQNIFQPPETPAENVIYQVVIDLLNNTIGIKDDLFEAGFSSIKVIDMVSKLKDHFIIDPSQVYEYRTIEKLAANLLSAQQPLVDQLREMSNTIKMIPEASQAFAHTPDLFKEKDIMNQKEYSNILILGVTGYFGAHLLHQLLHTIKSNFTTIVRAKNTLEAKKKVSSIFMHYYPGFDLEEFDQRINIYSGDLTKEYFGLTLEEYNQMAMKVDCIINSAANVRHYGKYSELEQINVIANKALLDFAVLGSEKDYNLISTLSVASGRIKDYQEVLFSEKHLDLAQVPSNVYTQTKLKAEIMADSRRKFQNVNIFRMGNLMFESETGIFQYNMEENAFYMLLRAINKTERFPAISLPIWDFTFVDQAAEAVTKLFDKPGLIGNNFHITNPNRVSPVELFSFMGAPRNAFFETSEYLSYLADKLHEGEVKKYIEEIILHTDMFGAQESTKFCIDYSSTVAILEQLGFHWKSLDQMQVNKMMEYCKAANFFRKR